MGFLFAAAVVLLIAALVLHSAHPKRAMAIAAIGVAGALAGVVLLLIDPDRDAPAAIPVSELALADVAITHDRYGAQLSGRVSNASARRLGTLTLTVTYKECATGGACRVLGEESPRLFLALPPGQTNGFSILLTQGALAAKPGVTWDCVIASAHSDF
ncbi:MAG: hypothetical protein JWO64_3301 [Hyphomicrobiales bacterium]|jgi:hypothetical protein|nr:hypothetical protein [Hyphomicrobiales bacterium]